MHTIATVGMLKEYSDPKWSEYFMDVAVRTSALSKDPNTKVGAVLVKNKRILSIGYNGAPSSFDDTLVPNDNNGTLPIDQKNSYMCHAELNAILNYRGSLLDLQGADLFVTTSPCNNCAIALTQLGIRSVVYKEKYHRKEITDVSEKIFENCGICYTNLTDLQRLIKSGIAGPEKFANKDIVINKDDFDFIVDDDE